MGHHHIHHHDPHEPHEHDWPAGRREGRRDERRGGPRRGPGGHGPRGEWGGRGEWGASWGGEWGRRGRPGPPPWLAGLFGLDDGEQRRGPRVRRGDVRSAILDVLRATDEDLNGYQVIQQIAERSGQAWKPSPGSVYPTIQQLQDEGLVAADDDRGRRTLSLTDAGRTHVAEHADELAAVWAPFEREADGAEARGGRARSPRQDVKAEIGQVMSAVWQIASAGSDAQRSAAVDVLVDTRRRLYGILADGAEPDRGSDEDDGVDVVDGDDGHPGGGRA